jgi:hypothetical protein
MRAGENFFLRKFSTIPLTMFARFARSLRSWNDEAGIVLRIQKPVVTYNLGKFSVTSKITFGENSRLDFIKQEQAFALWLSEA